MPYALGAVKPHVKTALEQAGARFGIRTIYGYVAKPGDHGKGLAGDLMINNLANGRAVGDAVSAWFIANAAALGVTYVIWYKRVWSVARASEGWRVYDYVKLKESDHTDHVHVSFAPQGGSGGLELVNLSDGYQQLANPFDNLTKVFTDFDAMLSHFTKKETWISYGFFVAGAVLVIMALLQMTGTNERAAQAAQAFIGSKMKAAQVVAEGGAE